MLRFLFRPSALLHKSGLYGKNTRYAKKFNNVETVSFEQEKDIGEHMKEITQGGADVVIDCVGMDGKMTPLDQAEKGYEIFDTKTDGCIKVVLQPSLRQIPAAVKRGNRKKGLFPDDISGFSPFCHSLTPSCMFSSITP